VDPLNGAAVQGMEDSCECRGSSVGVLSQASVSLNQARVSEKELSWFARELFAVSRCLLV
jgi:hypothetical protein